MWHRLWLAALAGLVMIAAGCGKSGDAGAPPPASIPATDQTAAASSDPAGVVNAFLDAIRTGNDEKAMSLLTPLARQKAKETNRSPTPPASDTARFEVGEVKLVGDSGAQVACKWTDLDESGKPHTDKALWVCRRDTEGWRVAGVAAIVFEGEDPLLLDFENPAEMAQKQEWLRAEIERRTKQETSPAGSGKEPIQAEKKNQDAFRR